jgi:hypothetical protein
MWLLLVLSIIAVLGLKISIWTEVLDTSFDKLRTSSVASRGVGDKPRVSERSEDPGC